jgi:hypothetical protein
MLRGGERQGIVHINALRFDIGSDGEERVDDVDVAM